MARQMNTLSFVEKEKIACFLRDICHPVEGEEGKARYEHDWNDERVSQHMTAMLDREVTTNNVQYLRDKVVGKLFAKKPATNGHLKPHHVLEDAIVGIIGTMNDLTNRVKFLEELLDKRTTP
jgi:hypothetical protein